VDVTRHPSPNFGQRRQNATPDLVVLHYTAMATCQDALTRLCDPDIEVSAHYLIAPDGHIFQLVAEQNRAWHAGTGSWGACHDVNSGSIGVELANDGKSAFPAAQMRALETLLSGVMGRWSIPPQRVIGHSDMAPGRKSDPGVMFDWRGLADAGLAVWPAEPYRHSLTPARFFALARVFGYSDQADDAAVLAAFRLRFRPGVSGAPDSTDMGMIQSLARRYPVDQPAASP